MRRVGTEVGGWFPGPGLCRPGVPRARRAGGPLALPQRQKAGAPGLTPGWPGEAGGSGHPAGQCPLPSSLREPPPPLPAARPPSVALSARCPRGTPGGRRGVAAPPGCPARRGARPWWEAWRQTGLCGAGVSVRVGAWGAVGEAGGRGPGPLQASPASPALPPRSRWIKWPPSVPSHP